MTVQTSSLLAESSLLIKCAREEKQAPMHVEATQVTCNPFNLHKNNLKLQQTSHSGGPLQTIANIQNIQRMVLYGVVQGGIPCDSVNIGKESNPAIFMDVQTYIKWILDNLSKKKVQ